MPIRTENQTDNALDAMLDNLMGLMAENNVSINVASERLRELHAESLKRRAEKEGVVIIRNEDDARAAIDAQALQRDNHALGEVRQYDMFIHAT